MTETEKNLRRIVVALIHRAGVFALRDDNLQEAFISGEINSTLKELGIDSLFEMELCIAIEEELGVSITPIELGALATLEALVERVGRLKKR